MTSRRRLPRRPILTGWLLLVVAASPVVGVPAPIGEPLLLGPTYPLEVGIALPGALLHWLDSLAGVEVVGATAGKTIDAHRAEYVRRFGPLDEDSEQALLRFAAARTALAGRLPPGQRHAPTLAFLEAADTASALAAISEVATPEELTSIRAAVQRFEPRYRRIWNDGAVPRRFVARVERDDRRDGLASFLGAVAGFYGVPAAAPPSPRLVIVPVAPGRGTHAQAIGRHLLLEVREADGLTEQVSAIVHENAHFLFYRVEPDRRGRLARLAGGRGEAGRETWRLLHEALPTALGQGIADRRFGHGFRVDVPWYHLEAVDAFAKRLYPLVNDTVRQEGRFDEAFVLESVTILEDAGRERPPTPRSP